MELDSPLTEIKGVGSKLAVRFAGLNIRTVRDVIEYFPYRYDDYSKVTTINKLQPGMVTIKAEIKQIGGRYVRRGMHITEAVASDETGSVKLVWFNQPYRVEATKQKQPYFITGKLEFKAGSYSIVSPSVEEASDTPLHTARIVPIYRQTKGLDSKLLRKVQAQVLDVADQLPEILPKKIIREFELYHYARAVRSLHFPKSKKNLEKAEHTMSFIEIFELMLASRMLKQEIASEPAAAINFDEDLAKKFTASLEFKLTDAQRKVMWQALQDMKKTTPMNRLLEGDVGSGKTIVAAMAAATAINDGFQAALLAPTELLARQHADSLEELLKPIGLNKGVGLLTGSLSAGAKKNARDGLKNGKIRLIVGTHALFEDLQMENLGLVVVDEQHRFGVEQRRRLLKQNGKLPHVLSMTATPIPRSLALTLYGELDISVLDAMPPGRREITTEIVSPNSRQPMEKRMQAEIESGHQVYVVCPVITEDNKLRAVSVEKTYKRLATTFKQFNVGLLHGRLKSDEKIKVMEEFVAGEIDMLVSTTVIEVGVNVPNATVMVIEGADRFGLAQMHQLRGRVGRSSSQSYCFVVPSDSSPPTKRLRAFSQLSDGFKLAEMDLELRGPGAIYGTMQHGALDLRFAKLTDHKLIADVREAVKGFSDDEKDIGIYPELKRRVRAAQAVVTLN